MRTGLHRFLLAVGLVVGVCVAIGAGSTLAAPRTPKAGSIQGFISAARNPMVPPGGTVAGKGYSYYLGRLLQIGYGVSSGAPPSCTVISVGGRRVAVLAAGAVRLTGATTCSEPAGRVLYVGGPAGSCSTLEGDHTGFGTTSVELVKCAHKALGGFAHLARRVTLDGRLTHSVLTATGVFSVPKVVQGGLCSSPCVAAPTAHAAGYGFGLLLRGLSKGTHVIHFTIGPPANASLTYTIHVS